MGCENEIALFQCEGKQKYENFETAHRIAKKQCRTKKRPRVVVYRCDACNAWHIGGHLKNRKAKNEKNHTAPD